VGRRHDRDGLLGDVDAVAQTGLVDRGKATDNERCGFVRDVQQHVIGPGALHDAVDGPGDDVAGRERPERMDVLHELDAVHRFEHAPLAADGFADEKRLGLGMIQAGRMKLDELHVGDRHARAVGHGNAVSGGDVRVGGVEIHLAAAPRGQHGHAGGKRLDLAGGFVEDIRPHATVGPGPAQLPRRDEVDGEVVFEQGDVRLPRHGLEQGAFDFPTGHVAGVQDPALAVAPFTAQVQLPSPVLAGRFAFAEPYAQLHELGNPGRPFLDDRSDDLLLAQPGPGVERVPHVQFEGILFAGDRGNAALGIVGVGFGAIFLGHDGDAAVGRHFEGEHQPRNAAAQHQIVVAFHGHLQVPRAVAGSGIRPGRVQSLALSIRRVLPTNTARAMWVPGRTCGTGSSVSESKNST
jgi:hypothetical protein